MVCDFYVCHVTIAIYHVTFCSVSCDAYSMSCDYYYWGEAPLVRSAFVRLSVYVGLTIFKVNKLLTLIAGFAPSMFYILLVIIIISPIKSAGKRHLSLETRHGQPGKYRQVFFVDS